MNLEELYTNVLKSVGMDIDDDSIVCDTELGDSGLDITNPVELDNKTLVFPVKQHLKKPSGKIFFHPLIEDITKPPTKVMNLIKRRLVSRLNLITPIIMQCILNIANDKETLHSLSNKQTNILQNLDLDDKTPNNFFTLSQKVIKENMFFVDLFLKRAANIKGEKYSRGAIISFPLYSELISKEEDSKIVVHKNIIRKKDYKAYLELFNILFPSIDKEHAYSVGINGHDATYFLVTVKAIKRIFKDINRIMEIFKGSPGFISGGVYDAFYTDIKWIDSLDSETYLEDFEEYLRKIPRNLNNLDSYEGEEVKPVNISKPEPVMNQILQPTIPSLNTQITPALSHKVPGEITMDELLAINPSIGQAPPNPSIGYMPSQNPYNQNQMLGGNGNRLPRWMMGGQPTSYALNSGLQQGLNYPNTLPYSSF